MLFFYFPNVKITSNDKVLDKVDVLEEIELKLNLDPPLILLPKVTNTKEPETTENEKDFEQNHILQAQVMKNIIFLYLFISTYLLYFLCIFFINMFSWIYTYVRAYNSLVCFFLVPEGESYVNWSDESKI